MNFAKKAQALSDLATTATATEWNKLFNGNPPRGIAIVTFPLPGEGLNNFDAKQELEERVRNLWWHIRSSVFEDEVRKGRGVSHEALEEYIESTGGIKARYNADYAELVKEFAHPAA